MRRYAYIDSGVFGGGGGGGDCELISWPVVVSASRQFWILGFMK